MENPITTATNLEKQAAAGWMKPVLIAAGIYNLIWGGFAVLLPATMFNWVGMDQPRYPQFWQCIGMIVGVYGIGYIIAAYNPIRHWPIVLVGFLGKVFGPIGMVGALYMGDLPWAFSINNITNDLIWLIPFAWILYEAARWHTGGWRVATAPETPDFSVATAKNFDQNGESLKNLSETRPTLVVFLRHLGCTFCRESLGEIGKQKAFLKDKDVNLVIVHMATDEALQPLLEKYELQDASRIADPTGELYRVFELERGNLWQLLGPRVWWRGMLAFFAGHGLGKLQGDGFQLPGAFLLHHNKIMKAERHTSAADVPNVCELVAGDPTNSNAPALPKGATVVAPANPS